MCCPIYALNHNRWETRKKSNNIVVNERKSNDTATMVENEFRKKKIVKSMVFTLSQSFRLFSPTHLYKLILFLCLLILYRYSFRNSLVICCSFFHLACCARFFHIYTNLILCKIHMIIIHSAQRNCTLMLWNIRRP